MDNRRSKVRIFNTLFFLFFNFGETRVYKNAATNAPTPTNTPLATWRADAAPVWVALAEAAVPVAPDAPEAAAPLPVAPALPLAGVEDTGVMIEVVALPTETTIVEVWFMLLPTRMVLKPEARAGRVAGSGCVVTTAGWVVTTSG